MTGIPATFVDLAALPGALVRTRFLDPVRLSDLVVPPGADPRLLRHPGCHHHPRCRSGWVLQILVRSGAVTVRQEGPAVTAGAGETVLLDCTRPHSVRAAAAPAALTALQVRHQALGLLPDPTRLLTDAVWPASDGPYDLAANTFTRLAEQLDEMDAPVGAAVGPTVVSLMAALCADRFAAHAGNPAVARQLLLLRVLSYIRGTLGDPALAPAALARRFGVSLRHIQALFAELGISPARWIRNERLARIHADLCNPQFDHLTVAVLGKTWGMPESSQVSRLFRARYGLTPSELRRRPVRISTDRCAPDPQSVTPLIDTLRCVPSGQPTEEQLPWSSSCPQT